MKLKPSLFPAILLIAALAIQLLPGCTPSPERSRLEHIEAIIDEHPDSAMALIDSVDTAALRSDRDRALYDLLYNLALYKSFNDSLDERALKSAVDVFTDCGDLSRASRSLYLLGKLQDLRKNYEKAAITLLQGYQLAKDNEDYFNKGLCAISLCEVYGNFYDSTRKIMYAKEAVDAFKKVNKTDWELYAKLYLAGAFITNQTPDSALIVLREIMSDPIALKDTTLLSSAYDNAAIAEISNGNDSVAIRFYAQAIRLDERNLSSGAKANITALLKLNRLSDLNQDDVTVLTEYADRNAIQKPFGVLALERNYKEAYENLNEYRKEQDEFIKKDNDEKP